MLCDLCRERPVALLVVDHPDDVDPMVYDLHPFLRPDAILERLVCVECDDGQWHESFELTFEERRELSELAAAESERALAVAA